VLNELARTGAVSLITDGRVAVRKTTPRVKGYGSDVVADIALRLRDYATTLIGNIESPETPVFVGFDEIPSVSADEAALFQVTFSDRAASLVDGVERWRVAQTRIRSNKGTKERPGSRVGVGVFLIAPQATSGVPSDKRSSLGHSTGKRSKR
jgi:hypothetical protein